MDYTNFLTAYETGQIDAIKLLLENGFNVNTRGFEYWTPLHYACKCDLYVNQYVANATPDCKNSDTCKHISMLKLLLKFNADINAVDTYNVPPIYYAIESENVEIIKLLINAGCDLSDRPSMIGKDGIFSPLQKASKCDNNNIYNIIKNAIEHNNIEETI